MQDRLTVLEYKVSSLEEKTNTMGDSLRSIQKTLEHIQFIAIGMVGYFVLQEFGFLAAFKAVSGLH